MRNSKSGIDILNGSEPAEERVLPTDNRQVGLARRAMMKTVAMAGLSVALPEVSICASLNRSDSNSRVIRYLESLARADGGYSWADQEQSHLTPTYAVLGCYRSLKEPPPRKEETAAFVRTHHPSRLKKLEQEHREFEYQQMQSLVWLGEDVSAFRDQVESWREPTKYLKQYEQHGYPILRHESAVFLCRALLGLPASGISAAYSNYLESRRRPNGSFNNTPAEDGADGNILNTWWGMQALHVLGRTEEKKAETVEWLRHCQLPGGGFTWQPRPEFAANDDVAYTWAAVRCLDLLGAAPLRREACAITSGHCPPPPAALPIVRGGNRIRWRRFTHWIA